jgi:tRNA pseudouridine13 synthase
LTKA